MQPSSKEVHAAAALLGRRGGLASGPARMKKMSPEQRRQVAVNAIRMRWEKYRREQAEAARRTGTPGANPQRQGVAGSAPGGGRVRRVADSDDARRGTPRRTRKRKSA